MIALTYLLRTEMHFVFIAAMLGHVSTSPFVLIAILFIYLLLFCENSILFILSLNIENYVRLLVLVAPFLATKCNYIFP